MLKEIAWKYISASYLPFNIAERAIFSLVSLKDHGVLPKLTNANQAYKICIVT